MGRQIFVIEQKVLLINFFLLAAHVLLKIKASVEPYLVSVVVLMRGCSGMGEFDAGIFFFLITVYLLQKCFGYVWNSCSLKEGTETSRRMTDEIGISPETNPLRV